MYLEKDNQLIDVSKYSQVLLEGSEVVFCNGNDKTYLKLKNGEDALFAYINILKYINQNVVILFRYSPGRDLGIELN